MNENLIKELNFLSEKLSDGLAVLKRTNINESDFVFKYINKSYQEIKNIENTDVLEKRINELFPDNNPNFLKKLDDVLVKQEPDYTEYYSNNLNKYYKVSILPEDKETLTMIYSDITENVRSRIANSSNKSIRSIRLVNEIILRARNKTELFNKTIQGLVKEFGFPLVWIVEFTFNSTEIKDTYFSDLDTDIQKTIKASLSQIYCIEQTYKKGVLTSFDSSNNECSNCPIKNLYKDCRFHVSVPIIYNSWNYGLLNIVLPNEWNIGIDESSLLKYMTDDLAFALFNLEVQKDLEITRKKVREYHDVIDSQNKKLQELDSELHAKVEELKIAKEKAKESELLKTSFLANVSHEIRTPLNGILGFSQLLKQINYSPDKIEEYIEIITNSGNLLLSTINSIMDISKIQSNQLSVNLTECNINSILNELYLEAKSSLDQNDNVKFELEIPELSKGNDFMCDETKLVRILNILIQNSQKFTLNGYIKLGLKEIEDSLVFFVEDTGVGIEKDDFNTIFESFRQSDGSSSRQYGGVGLGLAIAKGLVDILNGEIWLESELNKGTKFYVKLPYVLNENNQIHMKTMDLNRIETLNWISKKILIVEDDLYSIEYLSELLSASKAQLLFANNGNDAIKMAKENPDLDLILMDIQLPGLSGDQATILIREFNRDVPIIAQTAHAMVNDKESYIKAGCNNYISKPIAINELFSILCKYL